MSSLRFQRNIYSFIVVLLVGILFSSLPAAANPSKYPQFAQQSLPQDVTPTFATIDELIEEVKAGKKPLIVDVRSDEEYREAHILGSISAPLSDFTSRLTKIPRDRLVVLY